MTVAIERTVRRFKPYSGYKDSGVEWLGLIPSAWEVKPLKHLTTFATGWTPPTGRADLYGGEHLWANIGDLGPRLLTRTEKTITDAAIQEAGLRVVKAGSLLFSFKLSVGAVSIAGVDMYTNEAIAAFAPSKLIDTRYLYWAAPVLVPQNAQENIYGAPLLSRERIANALLLHPPQADQRAIADFLDRETTKIDDLIAKKEQLIELLQEKRTALVTRAVTKGLDPNVPLKDSGVEWLGKIPAHWDVKRLKFGAELNPSPLELRKLSQDREVSFVPMEAVGEFGGLDLSRTKPLSDVGSGYTYFADGDVIVAKITPCFENGKGALATGLANGIGFGTTELHVLRAIGGLERKYLFYLTLADAFRRLGKAEMYGAGGQKRVPESFVKNVRHPIPPIHEQRAIAAFLDRETAQIDALIAKIREGMERLKEFRTALISAAVTGKIDVREEAARSAVA